MSKTLLESIFEEYQSLVKVEPFWESHPNTIVYGAGKTGRKVFRILIEHGIDVICFFDQTAQPGDYWHGVPVLQPDATLPTAQKQQSAVVLALHNREVEVPLVIERLRNMGYTRFVTLFELYDYFAQELGASYYWLMARSHYRQFIQAITSTMSLWADQASRDLYAAIVRFRLLGDYAVSPRPDNLHQYFPPELPAWASPMRLVDCGAFDGDSIMRLLQAAYPMEAVAAFEPDEQNFHSLSQNIRSNKALANVTCWPCGVYSHTTQLRFEAGQGEGSRLSSEGAVIVQCVSLDEALPHFKPTLIKMDIEGAEFEALLGATQTIRSYRPGLAISLYHRPEHLWQIPLYLHRLCNGGGDSRRYRFFLRIHGHNDFELVVYAIPRGVK